MKDRLFRKTLFASAAVAVVSITIAAGNGAAADEGVKISEKFGFDPEDSTRFIQEAIDSGARKLIFDKKDSPWITKPLKGRSNLTVVFPKGVEVVAKKGEFHALGDHLFTFDCATNVFFNGKGAVLRMHKSDYQKPPYAKSEWRHALCFRNCENVKISGLKILSSGGDGLYIGDRYGNRACRNFVVRKCIFEDHHRQGISVISAENLLIEDCIIKGTDGTPPQAGIDFEPNRSTEYFSRCIVRRCRIENNKGAGIDLHFPHSRFLTMPLDITIEDCYSTGNRYGVVYSGSPKSDLVTGRIKVNRCVFEREAGAAVGIFNKPARSAAVCFENCSFVSNCVNSRVESDILFDMQGSKEETTDGVVFLDSKIVQGIRKEWFTIRGKSAIVKGVRSVLGKIEVVDADGNSSIKDLTPAFWAGDVAAEGVRIIDFSEKGGAK
jgi:hypothetical protein